MHPEMQGACLRLLGGCTFRMKYEGNSQPWGDPGELTGIAGKVATTGGGPAGSARKTRVPITPILKALFGGGGGRHAGRGRGFDTLCGLAPDTHSSTPRPPAPFILSPYAPPVPVIMVMCPFEIGSWLPLPLCSSLILELLFGDNLKS